MTPMDLQRAMQLQFLTQTNPLIELYFIKREIEESLIKQIFLNLDLREKWGNHCKIQQADQPHMTPNSSQSMFQAGSSSFTQQKKRKKSKRQIKKIKNDTKNIPKNFGKAIINFIEEKQTVVRKALAITGTSYQQFVDLLKTKKKYLHSIAELRGMWLEQSFPYAKQMRIISLCFLKRASLQYIFGSRILNYEGHIKYRNRFIQVLRTPDQFTYNQSMKK